MLNWIKSYTYLSGDPRIIAYRLRAYMAHIGNFRSIEVARLSSRSWGLTVYEPAKPDIQLGVYKTLKAAKAAAELLC